MPTSDWHNALKLGYDVQALQYPAWMSVGSPIGDANLAWLYHLPKGGGVGTGSRVCPVRG